MLDKYMYACCINMCRYCASVTAIFRIYIGFKDEYIIAELTLFKLYCFLTFPKLSQLIFFKIKKNI